ncbi:aliphatic sulfonate ABC transporter substrate-binding protein [Aureimonas fodinaquatilis]|uniref:Aliphatic sulfonate ABC transporter substrate-binding protein n=1 Tax=Aureimonas fodinaquatilis TaxID=2565783 RepID=A0A5B0E0K0_9HYPH|nr:aliphatic sulfonate ABC transporter substrate-binding protein [Aureimonas fodinaquatilis]KAA0972158.1 aliphatic sulfonate ABC transporter substrate-binding protein [Aureimonas fodinaquatilis]
MKNLIKHTAAALSALALLLGAAAAQAQEYPATVKIGATAPGSPKFIWHQHHGWLEEALKPHGVTVEWYPFVDGGGALVTALGSGGIDVAYNAGSSPALRIGAIHPNVNLIAVDNYEPFGAPSVVVAADSPIKTIEDLKGKRIGFPQGTVRHTTLAKVLDSVGLSLKDVETLHMAFDTSGPALVRGDIDALVEGETTVAELIDRGAARLLVDGNQHPEWSSPTVILTRTDYTERYPELIKTLLEVDLRISQWADANKDEALAVFAEQTKTNIGSLQRRYSHDVLYQDPIITDKAIAVLKTEEVFLRDAGLINGTVDYDRWVNDSTIKQVYSEAGLIN